MLEYNRDLIRRQFSRPLSCLQLAVLFCIGLYLCIDFGAMVIACLFLSRGWGDARNTTLVVAGAALIIAFFGFVSHFGSRG